MIIKYLMCFVPATLSLIVAVINLRKNPILIICLLIAYIVLMLLLAISFWQYEVHVLQKKNDSLKNGLDATVAARDEAQRQRDNLENKYYQLSSDHEQLITQIIEKLLPTADLEDKNGKREKNIQDSSDR